MFLYHGSNMPVESPRLIHSGRRLDFGAGFYLTSSFEQASKWAALTAKRRENGTACVTIFEFEEHSFDLKILRFEKADENWLRFVSSNRKKTAVGNDYDIVIGPVANDNTMPVINLYFSGVYTEEEAVKRLLPQKLKDQFVFKTEKALKVLVFKEVKSV